MSKKDQPSYPEEPRRRSDDIRRRRYAQSHTARQRSNPIHASSFLGSLTGRATARRRTSSVTGPPPVMARGFSARTSPAAKQRANKSRRLYNVSLSAQGAEMRLPTLPRLGLGWRAASFVLLAFLLSVLYYVWTAPTFQVSEAQISGLKRMTRGDVNKALALSGRPVFTLDADQVQQQLLEEFPEFAQVSTQVELPNTLLITVTERLPVLIWRQDGVSNLVDAEGMTFPARDETALSIYPVIEAIGDPPPLPGSLEPQEDQEASLVLEKVITDSLTLGLPVKGEAKPFLAPETVAALLQIIDQAPNGATIIYEPAHGFGWLDRRGWKVFLGQITPGDPAQIETKMLVYRAIMEEVKSAGAKPAFISVEFVHVPYYQLEPSE